MWKKYRKKPVVIEAYQWFWDMADTEEVEFDFRKNVGFIKTKAGPQYELVVSGDWIVKEENGEVHCWKRDKFEATYELAGNDLVSEQEKK
jgi:hypothetical protein